MQPQAQHPTTATPATQSGIPLRDRDPAIVAQAFSDLEPEDAALFVALHKYACDHKLGVASISQRTGITHSIISQAYNRTYIGDMHQIAARIQTFFYRLEQKELYGGLRQFVQTRLAKSLWSIFEKTRIIRRIQLIQSPEQLGKTRAAAEYTHLNNSGRTLHQVLPGGVKNGCGDFIWALAETLGIPSTVKLREKRLRIQQALTGCDLIIIDEAHLIWNWPLRAAAEFFDYLRTDIFADGARGVVMIATNCDMMQSIKKFRRESGYNIGQLLGRMRIDPITIDPLDDIVEEDVAALMTRYYKPGVRAIRAIHDLAQREGLGHFGLVDDIMNEAWSRSKAKKVPLSDDLVIEIARLSLDTLKQTR